MFTKKSISIILVIILTVSMVSFANINAFAITRITSPSSTNGSNYTSIPSLAAKLNEIFSGNVGLYKNYACTSPVNAPLGSRALIDDDYNNTYYVKSSNTGGTTSGTSCWIYANAVYNKLFKEYVGQGNSSPNSTTVIGGGYSSVSYSLFSNAGVKTGAYIRTTSNSNGAYNGNSGHSMIVLKYDASTITIIEGNADGNGLVCIATFTWQEFNNSHLSGRSRYTCGIVQPKVAYYNSLYPSTPAPTWATITTNKTSYATGETVSLTMSSDNATWYNISIYRNGTFINTVFNLGSSYNLNDLQDGSYGICMTAYNNSGQVDCSAAAYFTVGKYTVTYDVNGGSGVPSNQTKVYGTDITLSSNKPTRTGYIFNGWNTKADGSGTSYASGAKYTANADVILYAQWTAVTLNSISIKTMPTKTSYYVGDTLNTSGLTLTAAYSDGSTKTITSGFTCTPTALNTAGTRAITVSYGGKTTTFNITVSAVTVSSIAVKTMPTKTSYNIGETLNTSGLTLTATYNNGTTQTVSSGFTCSPTVLNTAGTQSITVSYGGKSATFNVAVVDNSTSPKYTVTSAKAVPGGTVVLTVSVANNPGIISLRNTVTFDETALELTKVENLSLLNGYTAPSPTMTSPYTLRWADSFATVNNTKNGAIVKLTFKVKDTAPEGSYTVTAVNTEARNVNGDTVAFASGSGTVTVTDVIAGDADGDGEVTDWDAIVLNRYLAGWNVTINEEACDVAENDGINDWDAIVLERYLAGWNVTLS